MITWSKAKAKKKALAAVAMALSLLDRSNDSFYGTGQSPSHQQRKRNGRFLPSPCRSDWAGCP